MTQFSVFLFFILFYMEHFVLNLLDEHISIINNLYLFDSYESNNNESK